MPSANSKSPPVFHRKKLIASAHSTLTSNTSTRHSKRLAWNNTWCCTKGLDDLGCGTVLGTGDGRLFVTQRFDRIEVGCTIRGVESEADADGGADQKSSDGPAVGENDVDLEPSCEQVSRNDPKNYSENSTGFRNEHGFGEELAQDVATACAD